MNAEQKNIRLPIFLSLLLVFLIFYPFFHQKFPEQIAILETFFAVIMVSGISLLINRKKLQFFMIIQAILILIGIIISDITQSYSVLTIVLLIELSFFIVIFLTLLDYIFNQEDITLDSLYSAITCYLVLGIIFAVFYTIMGTLSPDFFNYTISSQPILKVFPHPAFFSDALYFSFVTLSTLGYGDWVPVFGPIKMIASLEAIIGQLFIAILIAKLVTMQKIKNSNKTQ